MPRTGVLDQRRRQGTHVSASMVVPPDIKSLAVEGNVLLADYVNKSTFFKWDIFLSDDDGATWRHRSGGTWEGGPRTDPDTNEVNPPPRIDFTNIQELLGKRVRITLDSIGGVIMGIDVITT